MVPARVGSKRVPKKNLRYLGSKPLICYAIEAALESRSFDEIVLNSDGAIFKEIADFYGIEFYLRPPELGGDAANNDMFVKDFLVSRHCNKLVQLLPTSPYIEPSTIAEFVDTFERSAKNTCVSVARHQIASIYEREPINFRYSESHVPSQDVRPVFSYATVLMGWNAADFLERVTKHGFAYHGSSGDVEFFEIRGLELIDIDNEHDFQVAEAVLPYYLSRKSDIESEKEYFDSGNAIIKGSRY